MMLPDKQPIGLPAADELERSVISVMFQSADTFGWLGSAAGRKPTLSIAAALSAVAKTKAACMPRSKLAALAA